MRWSLVPTLGLIVLGGYGCFDSGKVLLVDADPGSGGAEDKIPEGGAGGVLMDEWTGFGSSPASEPAFSWEECPQYVSGNDLPICAATYLDSPGDDVLAAVEILSGGDVLVAGAFAHVPAGVSATNLRGSSGAALWRLTDAGRKSHSFTWVGDSVSDLRRDVSGERLVAAVDSQLLIINEEVSEVLLELPLGAPAVRVDVGEQGTLAAIDASGALHVFTPQGEPLWTRDIAGTSVNDVAVLDTAGLVVVTGAKDDPSGGCQGSVPFVRAFNGQQELVWSSWDFDSVGSECASTVGRRISRGADGLLYYAGHNWGGNTVHSRDPLDFQTYSTLIENDDFARGYGQAIREYGFVARLAPSSGALLTGSRVLPRDAENVGGEYLIDAIEADASGRVFVGARSTCCLKERTEQTIAGQSIGAYVQPEPAFLIFSESFNSRLTWTTFTSQSTASASVPALSVRDGVYVLGITAEGETGFLTESAIVQTSEQATPYLVTGQAP